MKVPAAGGVPTPVTTLQKGETGHVRPTFLPDGRHFIYTVTNGGMYVGALDSSDRTQLFERPDASTAMYSEGRLLFMRETTLMSQPFDLGRLALTGEPTPVAEQIQMVGAPLVASFSASDNGVLAYQTGTTTVGQSLTWFDRTGKPLGSVGDARRLYADLAMSPDSKSAAVSLPDGTRGTRDIWQIDLIRGLLRRFTFDPADDLTPVWSPDGRTIAFSSRRGGGHANLYQKPADSSREEEVLLADDTDKFPLSWSPDGRFLLYTANGPSGFELWTLPLSGDKKPVPFRRNQFSNRPAVFSPDGRWVAYSSNESGANQVYVVPFPGPGGQWQISTTGGTNPRWRDSKEIIYASLDGRLTAVAVNGAGQSFEVGASTPLFSVLSGGTRSFYDVATGGQRLLVNALRNEGTTTLPPLTVVSNWQTGR
jgi:WD40 repeat protein